jgi:hypothetical protein
VGSSSTRLGAITASSAGRYCHRNGGHRVQEMDISRPCERIDPPRSVYTSRISSCPGSKPGLWYPYPEGPRSLFGLVANYIVLLRKRYRLPREICGNRILSCPGNFIVLPGKFYRPARERITSAAGRYIVRSGKVYRLPQENLSSCSGKNRVVLPANSLFCGCDRITRSVFVSVRCLLCVL